MSESLIYHICTQASWQAQNNAPEYIHSSLEEENFIHCSEEHQIQGVLERYFEGQKNLILLTIDKSKVQPKIQYDNAPNGEDYPHIYGPINKNAIVEIKNINW